MKKKYTDALHFSVFHSDKGIFETNPLGIIDFQQLVRIYKGKRLESVTSKLQNAPIEERDAIKKTLPYITPHGTFKQRNNANLEHHNNNLVCLDIDGLNLRVLNEVCIALKQSPHTLLVAISPKMQGVKALVLVSENIAPKERYKLLSDKANNYTLARCLNIQDYVDKIDNAQFKLSQPMFLAFDLNMYVNEYATPLDIKFTSPPPPIEQRQAEFKTVPIKSKTRIEYYIKTATKKLSLHLSTLGEGKRHESIIKVNYIAGILHYAPSITSEVESMLLDAIIHSYGNEKNATAHGAIRSFKIAFNTDQSLYNSTIESIINELTPA